MPTRRQFLAAPILFKLGPKRPFLQAAAGPNDRIGIGFIGSGIRATQLMSEFLQMPGIDPVIVADLYDGYLERAKEQTEGRAATTKDYRQVLDNKNIDAVVIATPDHWHKRMTLEALAAGKHVYIEKPLTWSLAEGPEIVAAAEKSKRVVMVGSNPKTSMLTAKAREIVAAGKLGQVMQVRMVNHRNSPQGAWVYPIPPDASEKTIDWPRFLGNSPKKPFDPRIFFRWRCWWEYSGGVATDLFVHQLTQLHEIMDVPAPTSVVSQGGLYRWKDGRTVPDLLQSVFEYEKGFQAELCVNLDNGSPASGLTIMGTEATLVQGPTGLMLYPEVTRPDVQSYGTLAWPKAARSEYFVSKGWTAEGRPAEPLPPAPSPQEVTVERGPSHTEYFVLSIRNGSPSKETALEGHYAAGAAHLANMAYKSGRKMHWNYRTNAVS
jgi:predicted dehydrogenase